LALSPGQHAALRNLAAKLAGEEVGWINIADARALSELGLAERNREGWRITDEGQAALQTADAQAEPPDDPQHNIIAIRRPPNEGK
jgi:hypothetical protein